VIIHIERAWSISHPQINLETPVSLLYKMHGATSASTRNKNGARARKSSYLSNWRDSGAAGGDMISPQTVSSMMTRVQVKGMMFLVDI
jgi:hypothetical protein